MSKVKVLRFLGVMEVGIQPTRPLDLVLDLVLDHRHSEVALGGGRHLPIMLQSQSIASMLWPVSKALKIDIWWLFDST